MEAREEKARAKVAELTKKQEERQRKRAARKRRDDAFKYYVKERDLKFAKRVAYLMRKRKKKKYIYTEKDI